jgi:hypothetical protein
MMLPERRCGQRPRKPSRRHSAPMPSRNAYSLARRIASQKPGSAATRRLPT